MPVGHPCRWKREQRDGTVRKTQGTVAGLNDRRCGHRPMRAASSRKRQEDGGCPWSLQKEHSPAGIMILDL